MKFVNLSVTKYDDDEDLDESFEETTPELFNCKFPLKAATNRVRTMSHYPIVALMNDNAQVQILDLREAYQKFQETSSNFQMQPKIISQFLLKEEGFALQFSPFHPYLISGSNNGELNVFQARDDFTFDKQRTISSCHKSIEDIQFSSSDPNAFAFCSSDGLI